MAQTLKFLAGREYKGGLPSNKSCYYKKASTMFLINCGKGTVDALKRTKALSGVKEMFIVITCSNKQHLADLKKLLFILNAGGVKPKIIESISLNKKLLKRMGVVDGEDCQFLEPLSNNIKWLNFLATPHKDKNFSCPVELYLDGKKIFYGGDSGIIPFAIKGYDEYYFDFSDKQSEYFLDPIKTRNLVQKNSIKQNQLWLVHLESVNALRMAQKIGMQVAEEEKTKLQKIEKKQIKKDVDMAK